MATLAQNATDIAACATAIDEAIVAKGGTLVGGGKLRNAAAGIAAIPSSQTLGPAIRCNGKSIALSDTMTSTNMKIRARYCYETATDFYQTTIGFSIPFGGRINSSQSDIEIYNSNTGSPCGVIVRFSETLCNAPLLITPLTIELSKTRFDIFDLADNIISSNTYSERQISTPRKLALGGLNNNGSLLSGFSGRIYFIEIYESNVLTANYRPFVNNGVAGFKDFIGGTFYQSITSSAFEYVEG